MKKHSKRLFLLFLLSLMAACSQIDGNDALVSVEKSNCTNLLIDPGLSDITADEAMNVAILFEIGSGRLQTKAQAEISDVYTFCNDDGNPIFYAVNHADNKGFVVISASRSYYPILAYSENGRFDGDYRNCGLELWVIQQDNNIAWLKDNVSKEQTKLFRAAWDPYESSVPVRIFPNTKTEGIIDLRDSLITAWTEQGYAWTALSECPDGLPASIYNNWCTSAQSLANEEYDYLENSIIFYKTVVNSHSSVFATVTSEWAQDYPYNLDLPYYLNGNQAYAGCSTIALGQIMRYHRHPSSYDWYLMPDICYSSNSTVESFIHDLFDDFIMSTYYVTGHSTAKPMGTIASILENDYDYDVSYDNHNFINVMSSLDSGNPVYMSGLAPNSLMGHAWVCDGYNQQIYAKTFTLMILSQVNPPLQYESLGEYTGDAGSIAHFSMNWGNGGLYDGMYLDNTYYPESDYSSSRKDMFLDPIN